MPPLLLHSERPRSMLCTAWRAWRTLSASSIGLTGWRVRLVTTSDSIDRQAAAEEEKRGRQGSSIRHLMPSLRCGRHLTEAPGRPFGNGNGRSRSGSSAMCGARCAMHGAPLAGARSIEFETRRWLTTHQTAPSQPPRPLHLEIETAASMGTRFFGDFRL